MVSGRETRIQAEYLGRHSARRYAIWKTGGIRVRPASLQAGRPEAHRVPGTFGIKRKFQGRDEGASCGAVHACDPLPFRGGGVGIFLCTGR